LPLRIEYNKEELEEVEGTSCDIELVKLFAIMMAIVGGSCGLGVEFKNG
jgi:hypothetical protein